MTPYAVSKVAADFLGLQAFLGRGLRVIRARPFNHVGPGQADDFVVSALARRMVEAELRGSGTVQVGNLAASRDFTDVRDVVRAYRLLALNGVAGGGLQRLLRAGRSPSPPWPSRWPALLSYEVRARGGPGPLPPGRGPGARGDAVQARSPSRAGSPTIPLATTLVGRSRLLARAAGLIRPRR